MKRALVLSVLLLAGGGLRAQDGSGGGPPWFYRGVIPGGHRGRVNSLYYDGQWLLSAGEDGFLGVWDIGERRALMRFQLSARSILSTARRPGKTQIACVENAGLEQYRVSVWDYRSLKNLFTLRFQDPVQGISYSAGGNYLAVSRSGQTGVVLADSETGELLLDAWNTPEEFPSSAVFAAIGRTEKAMLVYSASGILSYWELKNSGGLRLEPALDNLAPLNFDVPGDLSSPLLFGNNRFFAGFDGAGLVVLQADTGLELDRDRSLTGGKLAAEGDELYCLALSAASPAGKAVPLTGREGIYRFRINNSGRLERTGFFPCPADAAPSALALIPRKGARPLAVIGTQGGEILPIDPDSPRSPPAALRVKNQLRITEAAAGERKIAFLTGEHSLGCIPLDFLELRGGDLVLEDAGEYTRLNAAGTASGAAGEELGDRFILWQDKSPLPRPQFRFLGAGSGLPLPGSPDPGRPAGVFPLRSVSVLEDRGLFLDTRGNISVISLEDGAIRYAETAAGSMDAAFIDRDTIILGRGPAGDPFLMIDTRTRETVPLPYPASIGVQVYRGPSGAIYGAALGGNAGEMRTSIIRIETRENVTPRRLAEYPGEEADLGIAEADGSIASTLGEIYQPWGTAGLERGPAVPLRIAGGGRCFIVLDAEGNISWHDPRTGKMLALFRLYEDEWTLGTAGSGLLRGRVRRR
jgi:hypothetical protein